MEKMTYFVEIKFKVTGDKMPEPEILEKDFAQWIDMWGEKTPLDVSEVDVTITIT